MFKGVPTFICQFCGKSFKIRSLRKGFSLIEVDKWLEKAQCPYCGKRIRQGEGLRDDMAL